MHAIRKEDTTGVNNRTDKSRSRTYLRRRIKEHREAIGRNEAGKEAQREVNDWRELNDVFRSDRPIEDLRDGPYCNSRRDHEHCNIHDSLNTTRKVVTDQVNNSCHQWEARNQEEQRRNEACLMCGFNTQIFLSHIDAQNVDSRSNCTTKHPHTKVVHVSLEHLATEELTEEGCNCHDRAFNPSPGVEEGEGRTG